MYNDGGIGENYEWWTKYIEHIWLDYKFFIFNNRLYWTGLEFTC